MATSKAKTAKRSLLKFSRFYSKFLVIISAALKCKMLVNSSELKSQGRLPKFTKRKKDSQWYVYRPRMFSLVVLTQKAGPVSIPQGQNLSLYFDLVAFLSQLFKIPFVQLLGQAVFLNYAEFVPLNTTVEPSLKATSDHNNHLCTKATFLSRQTVHTLNPVQTSLQRQRPLQRVFSCQNNLFNNNQFFSATDEKVKNSQEYLIRKTLYFDCSVCSKLNCPRYLQRMLQSLIFLSPSHFDSKYYPSFLRILSL